jgi:hypothetical protein
MAEVLRSDAILKAMARLMWRDYGLRAYRAFVVANPGGCVPAIERKLAAGR